MNRKVLILLIIGGFLCLLCGSGVGVIYGIFKQLPSLSALEYSEVEYWGLPTRVYSRDGRLIETFGSERRRIVRLDEISNYLIWAVIATEDARFYQHKGVDIVGLLRALLVNLKLLSIKEGGSTITQQLARALFLTPEKTLWRKLNEIMLALKIETKYTKSQILERYLNKIYFGHGNYGVEAAAQFYFNKSAKDLNLAEAAILAGIPRAPSKFSPFINPKLAKVRQATVLKRMVEVGYIDREQAVEASCEFDKVIASRQTNTTNSSFLYFTEYIRQYLENTYGEAAVYRGGLNVYTTMDVEMQTEAQRVIEEGVERINKFTKGGGLEGAMVVIDPKIAEVLALVGGTKFSKNNQFNRALQAYRQVGSAFKPISYAAAIEVGYLPVSKLIDAPVSYVGKDGKPWCPTNYDGKFRGEVSLRVALEQSLNVATVRMAKDIGLQNVISMAQRLGVTSPIPAELSIVLGTLDMTPLQLATIYAPFANGGFAIKPIFIREIRDRSGNLLEKHTPIKKPVISPQLAYIMTQLLCGAVEWGTGYAARLPCQVAGKTGTTSDYKDALFIGYTPDILACVWIGRDNNKPIYKGACGGRLAAPLWHEFMKNFYKPNDTFPIPEGIEFAWIDRNTNLLANDGCKSIVYEAFITGTAPKEICSCHKSTSLEILQDFTFETDTNTFIPDQPQILLEKEHLLE